ncbi:acetyl-CoA acetyltransferase [Amycolatopsis antarctica]|uniref:Acetyl-CoA acetyltransferase n=1 Tax=Amycolatopsis antarctica TaxID=1854586 RepID=A0A263D387_9PSEU|nr:beta-ketoacyl synthase N-terminal-like domain-containing protein [Amycolatopsis antarctica]OZM72087.1 acetyl-CoA acetyltransferase [Amycolatopsis antarctica]
MTEHGDVVVIGAASTAFGEFFHLGFGDLARAATAEALADAGLGLDAVDAAWLGTAFAYTYSDEGNAGTSLAEPLGLRGRPVTRVAAYCASGIDATRQAVAALRGRTCDVALVVGAEKMRDVGPRGSLVMQHVDRGHPLLSKGRTAPGIFGIVAERYRSVYGEVRPAMTAVARKNHAYGARNPRAHFRSEVSENQVESAPRLAGEIGLLDACPTTDGAAALVLVRAEDARGKRSATVSGIAMSNDLGYFTANTSPRFDMLGFESTRNAATAAYRQAGIDDPAGQLDVVELHDCFTITEIVNYEDLGLCDRGEGRDMVLSGATGDGGTIPVNTSGGLKACGHPIGATGVRMIVDICDQVWDRAGPRQVPGASRGLAHALGGPGSLACVAVISDPARPDDGTSR